MIVWLDGRLVPVEAARIDPRDRGLLLGDGLFETMRAVGGRVPLLDRHLRRLRAGAALLGIGPVAGDAAIAAACADLLRANGLADAALRLTLTRGPGPRGLLPPAESMPVILLAAFPPPAPPPPATAILATLTRRNEHSPLAGLKSLAYLDQLLALREARAAGADDALLRNTAGRLACATAANLFLVMAGGLLTPLLGEGVLPGITRGLVLELAAALGIACREEPLPVEAVAQAEGAFLTSSLVGLRPLVALDGRQIGSGGPHPLCTRLQKCWQAQISLT